MTSDLTICTRHTGHTCNAVYYKLYNLLYKAAEKLSLSRLCEPISRHICNQVKGQWHQRLVVANAPHVRHSSGRTQPQTKLIIVVVCSCCYFVCSQFLIWVIKYLCIYYDGMELSCIILYMSVDSTTCNLLKLHGPMVSTYFKTKAIT